MLNDLFSSWRKRIQFRMVIVSGTYNISWFGQDQNGNKVPSGVYFYEDDR